MEYINQELTTLNQKLAAIEHAKLALQDAIVNMGRLLGEAQSSAILELRATTTQIAIEGTLAIVKEAL